MVLGGVPGIVARVSQTEQMGKKGLDWANMLRDELSWQDEMGNGEEEEESEEEEEEEEEQQVDGAPSGPKQTEVEQKRDAVGAGPPAGSGLASEGLENNPEAAREEALAKQRAESLAAAAGQALAAPEEGVPNVDGATRQPGAPEPEPEPEPEGTVTQSTAENAQSAVGESKKGSRGRHKIGNAVKDDEPALSKKDADALRDLLKRLEEFDQICGKVRAAGDKPTAMKYAARRKELCKELAKPCADVLDVQESHYAGMHARLQRIAASLKKLELKAAELLATQDDPADEIEPAGSELAVVGKAFSPGEAQPSATESVAKQEMIDAQAKLDIALAQRDAAVVDLARQELETAEQKVADEVRDRERNQQQLQAAEVAMQQALAEHNEQAFAEAQRSMEEARKEREAIAEQEARLQAARDEKHNYKRSQKVQREGDIADGLQQLGGPSMQGAPPPTEAGRERLRATLEQAMKDFDANFNTMPDAMSCLGPGILEKVESLRKMTTADTDAVTAMLVRGRDLSAEESAELETEVTARDTERTTLIYSLMDELRRAQAICTSLMQAARLYLEAERARVAGERLAALEAIQHEQEMLMDATSKKRGAGDSPRKEGDDQAMVFRPKQGGAGGPDQPPPEPGSIEELNAMVVPKDELQQQKKEAQEEVDAAAQAVEDAAEALSKARKDADFASREQSAAAIAAAEQQLAEAKEQREAKEKAREKAREEHAALIDSKTATKLINAGATKNAQGLALLIGLLRERLEELQTLPKLEKEAKKLWRRTRRAEKSTVRITLMLRSLRNRHDEAIEYGEISSESDDDDLLYDDDFDLHNPEEVKAKMEKLGEVQLEKAKFIEKSRERLRELSVPLPELRFDLRAPPRTGRNEFDDEDPGMYD